MQTKREVPNKRKNRGFYYTPKCASNAMRRIEFPDWGAVLWQSELSPRAKHSFEITVRWYLSFCRRARAEVTVQSARHFIAWAVEEKHPQPWQIEEWKEAIRWFFLAAKE